MNFDVKVKKGNLAKFPELIIGNTGIESVERFNYLGITLDRALKLDSHLKDCIKRESGKLYMLGKLRVYMDKSTALKLFKCHCPT